MGPTFTWAWPTYAVPAGSKTSIKQIPLQKAISLNPKIREAYINLSASYSQIGQEEFDEAVQVLMRAEKVLPDDLRKCSTV